MNIAINTMSIGRAGGKDYAKMIVRSLAEIDKRNRYLVFLNPSKKEIVTSAENFEYLYSAFASKNILFRWLWEQICLPIILRKKSVNLLYNLSGYDIFFAPCKTIIKIGNMAPFEGEAITGENLKGRLRLTILKAIGYLSFYSANGVIAMSKTAQQHLANMFSMLQYKSFGILHSADLVNIGKLESEKSDNKVSQGYLLCVSNILSYKRYLELLEAFNIIIKKYGFENLIVKIAGAIKDREYFRKMEKFIHNNKLEKNVEFLGFVCRKRLYALYKNCSFLIFNSVVETCPRTLIEAMKCGTAILCSERSVMPEICQDAAIYFEPEKPEDIVEKLKMVLDNEDLKERMEEKSLERAKDFSWEKTAKETLNVFEEVYSGK